MRQGEGEGPGGWRLGRRPWMFGWWRIGAARISFDGESCCKQEAQRAINAAYVEVESVENGVRIVKLMGRYSGFIAIHATLASRDVDCCLIPESPFYLEGRGGLYEFVEKRLKENGHIVNVFAEGAGQVHVARNVGIINERDESGNRLLLDVGLWLSQKIKTLLT